MQARAGQLVVSVLGTIGAAIAQTGILYRLSLETITRMRGGFVGEATALACAGQLLGPAVPNATSRIIIIAPMLRELVQALGLSAKIKRGRGALHGGTDRLRAIWPP